MSPDVQLQTLTVEDATARIIAWLRNPNREPNAVHRPAIAEQFTITRVIEAALSERMDEMRRRNQPQGMTAYRLDTNTNAGPFHTAAWDLCRKGVLRPVAQEGFHGNPPPAFGYQFAVTPYGHHWLAAASGLEVLPAQYGRFAELLAGHAPRFGPGYQSRSQEAVRCYQAHAYLAACVMCGAAAESIFLALAIARTGAEERVLREYRTARGRSRVEDMVAGQQSAAVREALARYTALLKYWRDDAAHGAATAIDEEEAFTSLLLLMRFARWVEDQWTTLTVRPGDVRPSDQV